MYFLYPIEITSDNNLLVFRNDASQYVSLTPGVYYAYRSEVSSRWPSLYDAIETAVAQHPSVSGTYHFELATPAQSSGFVNSGLKLVRDAGTTTFGWNVSQGSFDYRLLGFNPENTLKLASTQDTEPIGDYSRAGVWQAPQTAMPKISGNHTYEQYRNNARRGHEVVTRWGSDGARLLRFGWVAAGHVLPYKNERADYASTAGLAVEDHGNYWFDLWDQGVSTYRDVLAVYGEPTSLELEPASGGLPWEVLFSPRKSEYADAFDSTHKERSEMAEFYELELTMGRLQADDEEVSGLANYRRAL